MSIELRTCETDADLEAWRRVRMAIVPNERTSSVEELSFRDFGSGVDDEGSLAFAKRFGFEETGRQVEQVRTVVPDEPWPAIPDGIDVLSLTERPELRTRTYHELAVEAFD